MNPEDMTERAYTLAREGKLGEAIAAFRDALGANPANALAWIGLGLTLYDAQGNPDEAIRALREAVALEPTNVAAWRGLGLVLDFRKRDYPAAVECFERCLELAPGSVEIPQLLGAARAKRLVGIYRALDLR
ncbi:MAG: tetratricopeptide repeat protein [Candidatus Lokiarchaeota archaeon]|nr:tetratricopeptide repeat protein [Candidatus Lokiarchaeota archaeon]